MARVAFVLADDFEDSEFTVPRDRLQDAGHEAVVFGSQAGVTLEGKRGRASARTDAALSEASPDDLDALVIPGGYSPDKLRLNDDAVGFTRQMMDADKPVAAICHAGQLLAQAEVVDGRKMTSWPSVRMELELAGANWVDEEVVVDGNLVTSRRPDDLDAFCGALLDKLR